MICQNIRDEFIHIMAQEGVSLKHTWEILKLAATVQRIETDDCNRRITSAEAGKRMAAVIRINQICKPYNVKPIFDSDPRGACVKLQFASGRTNDWAKSGFCVPTRSF